MNPSKIRPKSKCGFRIKVSFQRHNDQINFSNIMPKFHFCIQNKINLQEHQEEEILKMKKIICSFEGP